MEKKIAALNGKRIEVNCGNGIAFTGENLGLEDGVLTLECEGSKQLFIDAAKIVVVSEASDTGGKPGFIA
ncbi:MAG TPA: MM0924 family protein [Pyrinomonadaceae bacterium]|nr:MM0924 family protein [Pyrinomonadaceae bacterium]